jgi:hypothetical protein
MRIAAGVILIIAAVINLFASIGYFTIGGAGKLGAMVAEQQAKSGQQMTAESKEQFAKLDQASKQLGASGSALMGFAVFLLVTVGTSIAGAVCLFRRKAPKFILVACVLAVAAEVIGAVIIKFGAGNVLGLLGGILGLIGARSIMSGSAAPAGAPPPAAAAPM